MPRVLLAKMHGARNDFIVADLRDCDAGLDADDVRRLCDRRAGIGADGVLLLERSGVCDLRMRVFNADGGEAEMCGNGIRCVARLLDERGEAASLRVETAAGAIATQIVLREPEYLVRVGVGTPYLQRREHGTARATFVLLGNPHLVFEPDGDETVDLAATARALQSDPRYGDGVNLHEARYGRRNRIDVRHWERGAGETAACGTGVAAAAVVAIERGRVTSPVDVVSPGGAFEVAWDGKGTAFLTGPAAHVFDTVVELPERARA